jgi:hypothetical protein
MSDLQALFEAIDHLPPDELEQVHNHVMERRTMQKQIAEESVEERIAALNRAFAEMREGLSKEELAEMIEAMNSEYISPKDLQMYDWLDDLPEDER